MADFKIAYAITGKTEGGYVNDPDDHGGETYAGITYKNFPKWKGWPIVFAHKPLARGAIINDPVLPGLVAEFYYENFWLPVGGNDLEDQVLANQVYDMAVNSSVEEALLLLNRS